MILAVYLVKTALFAVMMCALGVYGVVEYGSWVYLVITVAGLAGFKPFVVMLRGRRPRIVANSMVLSGVCLGSMSLSYCMEDAPWWTLLAVLVYFSLDAAVHGMMYKGGTDCKVSLSRWLYALQSALMALLLVAAPFCAGIMRPDCLVVYFLSVIWPLAFFCRFFFLSAHRWRCAALRIGMWPVAGYSVASTSAVFLLNESSHMPFTMVIILGATAAVCVINAVMSLAENIRCGRNPWCRP